MTVCADEIQRAAYQRYYLENHVPLEFRGRLAEETHEAGRLLPAVFQAFQQNKPQAPAEAPVTLEAPAHTAAIDELFQLCGVRRAKEPPALLVSVGKRFAWLLCTIVAGVLAALLTGFYQIQLQRVAAMVLFVPVVLALAESAALLSVALSVLAVREPGLTGAVVARHLGKELLAGLLLGLACGLIVAGVAQVWTRSVPLALSLGGALAGGMTGAAVLGSLLPSLLRWLRWDNRFAAGPVARALTGLLALVLYFGLSCLLLRK